MNWTLIEDTLPVDMTRVFIIWVVLGRVIVSEAIYRDGAFHNLQNNCVMKPSDGIVKAWMPCSIQYI